MGLFDKFTKKTYGRKQEKDESKDNVLDMVKDDTKAKPVVLKEDTGRALFVLKNYHLSEKSNILSTKGVYVFKVNTTANKIEIKKAVEKVYDVHVVRINIVNNRGKSRRMGRTVGRTSDWKKAIVTLKKGETIGGLAEGV
jgi:large subunit ribosomal protein L23